MLRLSVSLITLALLSGCTTVQHRNHQETIAAINNIETNINSQISSVAAQVNSQQQYIAKLEDQLTSISKDLKTLKKKVAAKPKVIVKKEVMTIPEENKPFDTKVANGKTILGEEEWVWIDSTKNHFKARVDTGATTSSLNAVDIQTFERDGKEWVRFNLDHTVNDSQSKSDHLDVKNPQTEQIEAPILRWVKIRQASNEDTVRRPVINAWITLGGLHEKAEFTLADRTKMDYPVLLGREFFKDIALVDVGKQFVQGKAKPATVSAKK